MVRLPAVFLLLVALLAGCGSTKQAGQPNTNTGAVKGSGKQPANATEMTTLNAYYGDLSQRKFHQAYRLLDPRHRRPFARWKRQWTGLKGITIQGVRPSGYRITRGNRVYTCMGLQIDVARGSVQHLRSGILVEVAPRTLSPWYVVPGSTRLVRGGTLKTPTKAQCKARLPA